MALQCKSQVLTAVSRTRCDLPFITFWSFSPLLHCISLHGGGVHTGLPLSLQHPRCARASAPLSSQGLTSGGKSLLGSFIPHKRGFPGGSAVKNPPGNAGDMSSIPGLGRSPGEGQPTPGFLLGKPLDREAWWAALHRVAKSWTQVEQPSTHTHALTSHGVVAGLFLVECQVAGMHDLREESPGLPH